MKKTFLIAACAALALGTAQAAGLNWAQLPNVDGYTSLGTYDSPNRYRNISFGDKWTVLANVTFENVSAITSDWPGVLGVSTNVDNGTNGNLQSPWRVLVNGGPNTIGATDASVQNAPVLTNGTHEVAICADGTITTTSPASITVYEPGGARVLHAAGVTSLSLEGLPRGIYVIGVEAEGRRQMMKVVW